MDKVEIVLEKLKKQCPNLCPVFYPGDISEKQVMKLVKEKGKMPKISKKCSICENNEGKMNAQVFCDYDLEGRKMIIKSVKVCNMDIFDE